MRPIFLCLFLSLFLLHLSTPSPTIAEKTKTAATTVGLDIEMASMGAHPALPTQSFNGIATGFGGTIHRGIFGGRIIYSGYIPKVESDEVAQAMLVSGSMKREVYEMVVEIENHLRYLSVGENNNADFSTSLKISREIFQQVYGKVLSVHNYRHTENHNQFLVGIGLGCTIQMLDIDMDVAFWKSPLMSENIWHGKISKQIELAHISVNNIVNTEKEQVFWIAVNFKL